MDLKHAKSVMQLFCMSEYCYSIMQTKSANHNCPVRREEDEGLGIENINWDLIKYRRLIYC